MSPTERCHPFLRAGRIWERPLTLGFAHPKDACLPSSSSKGRQGVVYLAFFGSSKKIK